MLMPRRALLLGAFIASGVIAQVDARLPPAARVLSEPAGPTLMRALAAERSVADVVESLTKALDDNAGSLAEPQRGRLYIALCTTIEPATGMVVVSEDAQVATIARGLLRENTSIRRVIAEQLAAASPHVPRTRSAPLVEALCGSLQDESHELVRCAAVALGRMREIDRPDGLRAARALAALLVDPANEIPVAWAALQKASDEGVYPPPEPASLSFRLAIAEAMVQLQPLQDSIAITRQLDAEGKRALSHALVRLAWGAWPWREATTEQRLRVLRDYKEAMTSRAPGARFEDFPSFVQVLSDQTMEATVRQFAAETLLEFAAASGDTAVLTAASGAIHRAKLNRAP